ncbi:MAG: CoA-binding protein [Proteobacteria bacterium]|nr:CoA-binding protein [Pseudomonadota bacterium]
MATELSTIMSPKAIAIVGASKDSVKRGYKALKMLLDDDFKGDIYPINPKEKEILGIQCFPSVSSVEGQIDLAILCIPATRVPQAIKECGEKGVKGAVILAVGFGESGEVGEALETETIQIAKRSNLRIIGPNTSGVFNTSKNLNIVGFSSLNRGVIGLISQSGNMALSMVTEAEAHGHLGFSSYIGVGNESDLQFHDYLDYFTDDDNTSVVISYVEGFKRGDKFIQSAKRLVRQKPLVLFKSGKTSSGQESARSHTGALAGDYAVAKGIMQQCGITLVHSTDLILPVAETLAYLPPAAGNRIAILADGGGHATIAADYLSEKNIPLAKISEETKKNLRNILPTAASISNPIDVAGGADDDPQVLSKCAEFLIADPAVDSVLVVGLFGGYQLRFSSLLKEEESIAAEKFGELLREHHKPILVYSVYANYDTDAINSLRKNRIPLLNSVETACFCLNALIEYGVSRQKLLTEKQTTTIVQNGSGIQIIDNVVEDGRNAMYEYEAKDLLATSGVNVPLSTVVRKKEELDKVHDQLTQHPYAMKLVSRDILHKSDAGGVKLNLSSSEEFKSAFEEIMINAGNYQKDALIEGVLISPMAQKGVELIIGVTQDPQFGPVIMFGLGGVFVEVLKDVVFRSLPLSEQDVHEMLNEIKSKAILQGVRGKLPVDIKSIVDLMMRVSDLCITHPQIDELDLNPVIVYPQGYSIVDARITLKT